ncbi:MAG: thermonuclease family protein [Candidatus Omnitrophota bacterium]
MTKAATRYKVTTIIDGDTLEVMPNWNWNEHEGNVVRPVGYDTPEWGQPVYQEAKDKLTDLILNKEVEFKNPIMHTYERVLCYVYYQGRNVVEYFGK